MAYLYHSNILSKHILNVTMNPNHVALSNTNSKRVDYLTVDRKAGMTPLLLAATGENGPNILALESFIES